MVLLLMILDIPQKADVDKKNQKGASAATYEFHASNSVIEITTK